LVSPQTQIFALTLVVAYLDLARFLSLSWNLHLIWQVLVKGISEFQLERSDLVMDRQQWRKVLYKVNGNLLEGQLSEKQTK
jgi:hypothetical protein